MREIGHPFRNSQGNLSKVQRLDDWATACRTLRLRNYSVFISESNSKLLSREFTKELSGRYVAFRIRPFVYRELAEYATQLKKKYLNELNNTIVLNDIITRYKIRQTEVFKRLANYVLISNARIFSARSIADYMKTNSVKCSVTTILKYIGYLEEAYVIAPVKLYSTKAKRELNYYQKMYDEDVSFNSIRVFDKRYDITHNFENAIYNELIYMGYKVQVYNDGKHEIDFIANKDGKTFYIQAAYSVAEEKAYNREFGAFSSLDNSIQKIVISNDEIDYSTSTVRHIQFKDFVMMKEL